MNDMLTEAISYEIIEAIECILDEFDTEVRDEHMIHAFHTGNIEVMQCLSTHYKLEEWMMEDALLSCKLNAIRFMTEKGFILDSWNLIDLLTRDNINPEFFDILDYVFIDRGYKLDDKQMREIFSSLSSKGQYVMLAYIVNKLGFMPDEIERIEMEI